MYLALSVVTIILYRYVSKRVDVFRMNSMVHTIRDVFVVWGVIIVSMAFLMFLNNISEGMQHFFKPVIFAWLVISPYILLLSRLAVNMIANWLNGERNVISAVVVGINPTSRHLISELKDHRSEQHVNVLGYFDDREDDRHGSALENGFGPLLGGINSVAEYVRVNKVQKVYISLPFSSHPRIRAIVDELHDATASIYFVPEMNAFNLMQARTDHIGSIPLMSLGETPFSGFNAVIKNMSDFIFASIILILISPIMLVVALAVKFSSRGPIIFKQRRYGLNGEEIIVYKFRSMTVCEDGDRVIQATKNDRRVTKVGAFLRKTSLDELPQFINVLQGRMSIVGPRPHAVTQNEQYRKLIKGYMLRHKIKPGITGWAQINGYRGEIDTLDKMQSRVQYDLDYYNHWSLFLDLKIILRTMMVFTHNENAY
jgi:putative colanic acid biosynthesis UDP-glucose lipid carrier transferase